MKIKTMKTPDAPSTTATFVFSAVQIIEEVSHRLPTNLRWAKYQSDFRMRCRKQLLPSNGPTNFVPNIEKVYSMSPNPIFDMPSVFYVVVLNLYEDFVGSKFQK